VIVKPKKDINFDDAIFDVINAQPNNIANNGKYRDWLDLFRVILGGFSVVASPIIFILSSRLNFDNKSFREVTIVETGIVKTPLALPIIFATTI
jgi:hypothetical protein